MERLRALLLFERVKNVAKVKVTGVVKYDGVWRRPGDVLEKVPDEIANQMVSQDVAEIISVSDEPPAELQYLRARAHELGVPRANQMGEEKLKVAIAEKESELANKETPQKE